MHIIMGGTGHVGTHAANVLLAAGEEVGVVTRNLKGAGDLRDAGAVIIEADVDDVASLRAALRRGRRAFLLNPPGDISKDSDAIERRQVANILTALEGASLEKIVVESVGGARRGERIGDLSVLWQLQQGAAAQSIPAAINGAGYYMSNWDAQLDTVRKIGILTTMFPGDLMMPMVAPADLGRVAAERLLSSTQDVGIRNIEGPERYSCKDVAEAFARALGRDVHLDVTPVDQLKQAFQQMGFSEASADSYARMTRVAIEQNEKADKNTADVWRGEVTLQAYIDELVAASETAA